MRKLRDIRFICCHISLSWLTFSWKEKKHSSTWKPKNRVKLINIIIILTPLVHSSLRMRTDMMQCACVMMKTNCRRTTYVSNTIYWGTSHYEKLYLRPHRTKPVEPVLAKFGAFDYVIYVTWPATVHLHRIVIVKGLRLDAYIRAKLILLLTLHGDFFLKIFCMSGTPRSADFSRSVLSNRTTIDAVWPNNRPNNRPNSVFMIDPSNSSQLWSKLKIFYACMVAADE
jgi:hypothetical protein